MKPEGDDEPRAEDPYRDAEERRKATDAACREATAKLFAQPRRRLSGEELLAMAERAKRGKVGR